MARSIITSFGKVARFEEPTPHEVLGPIPLGEGRYRIVAYLPFAKDAWIESGEKGLKTGLNETEIDGIYSAELEYDCVDQGYEVCFEDSTGYVHRRGDPYAYKPELSEFDIFLYRKGELYRSYETLGAHPKARDGTDGTRFVVWAPNAVAVSVVGDFNHWTRGMHPMTNVRNSGIWEVFIPGVSAGEVYKYAVRHTNNYVSERADPYSFRNEMRPRTGSVVTDMRYKWKDGKWMRDRRRKNSRSVPISIYEVHLGSWKKPGKNGFHGIREIGEQLMHYCLAKGFTHIELMPIMEHPLDASWGYQVVNYYAPTSRYGDPVDYMWFIDICHSHGLGVILDWVPAHFPNDEYGLSNFDGTHLYDHADPRLGLHPDWNTRIFNYGRPEVRNFLISNAIYWADYFHADGIRIDAVSSMLYLDYSRNEGEWIPNKYGGRENLEAIEFIRHLNRTLHDLYPGIMTVAEESTAWEGVTRPAELGGLGFDFKWNMGWMHDTLYYFSKDPVYRKYEHDKLTFNVWYAFSENFILPFSHDEVVHLKGSLFNKMPGDLWQKFANLRLCFVYMFSSPGKKLIFMGDEFGQSGEWSETRSLSWDESSDDQRTKLTKLVSDLNNLYVNSADLYASDTESSGFQWIDFNDRSQSVITFMRSTGDEDEGLIFVFNFTPIPRYRYAIGVPWKGEYVEALNSDATSYGGSGISNQEPVTATGRPFHGRPYSIEITLPPLAGIMLKLRGGKK